MINPAFSGLSAAMLCYTVTNYGVITMKKIVASVELYNGAHKERVSVEITEDDLKELAARKAFDNYHCVSCETVSVEITMTV